MLSIRKEELGVLGYAQVCGFFLVRLERSAVEMRVAGRRGWGGEGIQPSRIWHILGFIVACPFFLSFDHRSLYTCCTSCYQGPSRLPLFFHFFLWTFYVHHRSSRVLSQVTRLKRRYFG